VTDEGEGPAKGHAVSPPPPVPAAFISGLCGWLAAWAGQRGPPTLFRHTHRTHGAGGEACPPPVWAAKKAEGTCEEGNRPTARCAMFSSGFCLRPKAPHHPRGRGGGPSRHLTGNQQIPPPPGPGTPPSHRGGGYKRRPPTRLVAKKAPGTPGLPWLHRRGGCESERCLVKKICTI